MAALVVINSMHGRSFVIAHRPSYPYNTGTEHLGGKCFHEETIRKEKAFFIRAWDTVLTLLTLEWLVLAMNGGSITGTPGGGRGTAGTLSSVGWLNVALLCVPTDDMIVPRNFYLFATPKVIPHKF